MQMVLKTIIHSKTRIRKRRRLHFIYCWSIEKRDIASTLYLISVECSWSNKSKAMGYLSYRGSIKNWHAIESRLEILLMTNDVLIFCFSGYIFINTQHSSLKYECHTKGRKKHVILRMIQSQQQQFNDFKLEDFTATSIT